MLPGQILDTEVTMQYFVFTNALAVEFFEYLMLGHRERVKAMMDLAQTGAADSMADTERNQPIYGSDDRVIERLAEELEEFVVADCSAAVSSHTRFWTDRLEDLIQDTDFHSIAAAIYYGVEVGSDPRAKSDSELE